MKYNYGTSLNLCEIDFNFNIVGKTADNFNK